MIEFYVMRIIKGTTSIDNVPLPLKAQVKARLIEKGFEVLTLNKGV